MSEYLEKYDVASEATGSLIGKAPGLALATATDIVTTMWNSLPFTNEVKTEDVLGALDKDALSVYQENTDAVKTMSLVGGSLVPGVVGLKLLNRARSGLTSLGYTENYVGGAFAGTKQRAITSEIEKIFAESGSATLEYKNATRRLLAANVTKEVVDNAAIEIAILGVMNAHPYMEDYKEDPLKNFALGVAFGGAIGASFAVPSTRRAVMDATGNIAADALSTVAGAYKQVDEAFSSTARFQAHTANVKRLNEIAGDDRLNGLTREIAASFKLQEGAAREETLADLAPFLYSIDKESGKSVVRDVEMKNAIIEMIGDNRYIGVDKIRIYDMDKAVQQTPKTMQIVSAASGNKNLLAQIQSGLSRLGSSVDVMDNTFVTPDGKRAMVFTRISTGEIFEAKGARNAALAGDIKQHTTYTAIGDAKSIPAELGAPVKDFAEDNLLRSISSSRSDARFIREMRLAEKADLSSLSYVTIAPDDLPRMNGLVSKLSMLPEDVRSKLVINFRSDMPSYNQSQTFLEKTVGKDYQNKAKVISENKANSIYNIKTSTEAHEMLSGWLSGSLAPLRRAMDSFQRGTPLPRSEAGNERLAKELWDAGQKTRDEFKKIADADGYVYLYRGIRGSIKGHAAVESYTVGGHVAPNFGTPHLFKVNVDNIIGSVSNPNFREMEILVGSPHNQVVTNIPTAANKAVSIPGAGNQQTINPDDLYRVYTDETERQVKGMLGQNGQASVNQFAIEEISARLNITTNAIRGIISGESLADMAQQGMKWQRYSDAEKIDTEYLHPKNRLYALVGNPVKNQNAEAMANLDARQMRVAHTETIEQMTLLSQSTLGKTFLDIYKDKGFQLALDDLMANIGKINNQLVGDPRWQSADQALRKIISGPVLTAAGKLIINQTDKLKRELLEPLAANFLKLKDNIAAIPEFNRALNKLYSLEGWRDIKIGEDGFATIIQRDKKGVEITVKDANGDAFVIKQAAVIDALEGMRKPSQELLKLHNLNRSITGKGPLNDLGFYTPPISLINKSYAFVIDKSGQGGVRLLTASSGPELESLIQAFSKENAGIMSFTDIVRKGEQSDYNLIKGYSDYESHTTYANVAYQHKGSSSLAIDPSDSRLLENVMSSYENLILQGGRKYAETYMHDITGWLDKLSAFYKRAVEDQPTKPTKKESTKDSALTVKNILLGRDQLEQSSGLKAANSFTDLMLNRAYNAVDNVIRTTGIAGAKVVTQEHYDKIAKAVENAGIAPIWKSFDEYLATTRAEGKNVAPMIVSMGNGLLATVQLRMFEVAQAAVNIMSMPILTWGALMERMPGTAINPQGDSLKFPLRAMYAGIRQMFSPEGLRLEKELWEPKGLIDQTVRQYTETIGALKGAIQGGDALDRGMQAMVDFQNSKAVSLMSKPSDFAEKLTRRFAMHTGYWAAKQAYPGIDDAGATIAAMSFTDRSIGNYHAAQRPTAFQGTFGAALGLYQTYFLTFAQSAYRGLEDRNFKQLAGMAAIQAGTFGISSWPGFSIMSEQIVAKFNDDHYDLTTGTFRAAGKETAELILYGLPSSLGPAYYTRGDISPRIPSGLQELAIVNGTREGFNAMAQIIKKTGEGIGQGTPIQSMFEALSLQSLNRPLARWSELVTGSSLTQQGNTVSPKSEVWTPMGVTARLLATRPIEEQVVRNARHLDTFYGQADFENRQGAVRKLKTAIRDNSLDDKMISEAALEYTRFGGSSKGWNAAINEAITTTEDGTRAGLKRKLEPDSPIHHMINDLW